MSLFPNVISAIKPHREQDSWAQPLGFVTGVTYRGKLSLGLLDLSNRDAQGSGYGWSNRGEVHVL